MFLSRNIRIAAVVLVVGLTACGDELERILIPVPDESLEATLVDFSGGDLTRPSAFDLISGSAVRTDQFSGWDFVLELLPNGSAVIWPRGGIAEEASDSGLRLMARTFDGLTTAPEDGYDLAGPVAISVGDVLAVQSRRDPAFGSVRCRRYAKIEILSIDGTEAAVTFRHLVNPNCEQRTLVPGAKE